MTAEARKVRAKPFGVMSAFRRPLRAGGPCKVCGGSSRLFCIRDIADSCEDRRSKVFPRAGVGASYFSCTSCGFLFTRHFDALTDAEMGNLIYNEDYIKVDPDFAGERPEYISRIMSDVLSDVKSGIFTLDYGAGEGQLSDLLVREGFAGSDCYDPHFSDKPMPDRRYELVTAFEVVEHSREPLATFRDAFSPVAEGGALLFSTQLMVRDTPRNWWYIAPRNGHVSIHTERSLLHLAGSCGAAYLPLGAGLHLFYRDARSRVVRAFARRYAGAILYQASEAGISALVRAHVRLSEAGVSRTTMSPRHLARAMLGPFIVRGESLLAAFQRAAPQETGTA